jgi:hypothetical protein
MSEERNELEDNAGELRDQLVSWRRLDESGEWAGMCAYIRDMLKNREAVLRTPLKSLEEALGQEYVKGEVSMAEFLMQIPKAQIERIEIELAALTRTLEENQDASGSTASDDPERQLDPIDSGRNPFAE